MRGTSMHHDKTLQMNIDNGAYLFLTAIIYNETRHYLRMKTSSAQVNHSLITISLSQAGRVNTLYNKKRQNFLLMMTVD